MEYSPIFSLFDPLCSPRRARNRAPSIKKWPPSAHFRIFFGCLFSTCSQCQNQRFPHRNSLLYPQIRKVNLCNDRNIIIFQVGSQRLFLLTLHIPGNIPEYKSANNLPYSKRNSRITSTAQPLAPNWCQVGEPAPFNKEWASAVNRQSKCVSFR